MKLAVVLRKDQSRVSLADEHDADRIAAYCRAMDSVHGTQTTVVRPPQREDLLVGGRHDRYLFVGTDAFTLPFVERLDASSPVYLWAKAYNLTVDPQWVPVLPRLRILFNSCYITGAVDRPGENVQYLPTAFHWPWRSTLRERLQAFKNAFVRAERFDLVFAGSGRIVRSDQYRQRVLNRLAEMGLKICVAAPAHAWAPPPDDPGREVLPLHPDIHVLGNWGDERFFQRARCVLDLPWLDTVLPPMGSGRDVNGLVWSIGWNLFRLGAFGANVLTHDAPAIRDLGLDGSNCTFYRSGVEDIEALAQEIHERVRGMHAEEGAARRAALRTLFHSRHRYIDRWQHIYREILKTDAP